VLEWLMPTASPLPAPSKAALRRAGDLR